MSGVELTLAVLPLIITAAEHHREVIRIGKNLTSNKAKNEQQLDFYYELYDELALLENTLRGIVRGLPSRVNNTGFFPLTEDDHEEINTVLGSSAAPFQDILKRLLKSLEALVSDKSLDLAKSALHHVSCRRLPLFLCALRKYDCSNPPKNYSKNSSILNARSMVGKQRSHCGTDSNSPGTKKVALSPCLEYGRRMSNSNVYSAAHFSLETMNSVGWGQKSLTPQGSADSLSPCSTKSLGNGRRHASVTANTRQGFASGTVAPTSGFKGPAIALICWSR